MALLLFILKLFCIIIGACIAIMVIAYLIEAWLRIRELWKDRNNSVMPVFDILPIPDPLPLPAKLITSCEDLKFSDFIRCETEKDYKPLIVAGDPTDDEIFQAWISILSQYYTLTGNKESANHIALVSKIERMHAKIMHVTALANLLKIKYSVKVIEALKAWGYKKPFTDKSYLKDAERVLVELKNDKLKLVIARQQFTEQQESKENSGEIAATREYYLKTLIAINNHHKQHYRASDISTMEFAVMYKDIMDYSAALKAMN